jgi:hypothetical protein
MVAVALVALAGPRRLWEGHRTLIIACGLTLAAATAFLAGMGYYAPRLSFNLVPPLVLVAGLAAANVRAHAAALPVVLAGGTAALLVATTLTPGPYH